MDRHKPDWHFYASLGEIKGLTRLRRFGYNPDIDTTTLPEDIWGAGGVYTFPSTTETLNVSSSSGNDTSGGTGMRVVRITGLDSNYDEISEDVTLNGTSAVLTSKSFRMVHSCFGISSGSSEQNEGNITIANSSSALTLAYIPANQGQTQQTFHIVPRGHVWLVDTVVSSTIRQGTGAFSVDYEIQINGTNTWRNLFPVGGNSQGSGFLSSKTGHKDYVVLPEKTKVRVRCRSVSANNTGITANIGGYLVDLREGQNNVL